MQWLESISELEIRLVDHDLFGEIVVGRHGRAKGFSLFAGFVCLRRAGRERLAWSRICWWIIDSEDFTSVRIENGHKVAWVCVKVIIRTKSGENETLL